MSRTLLVHVVATSWSLLRLPCRLRLWSAKPSQVAAAIDAERDIAFIKDEKLNRPVVPDGNVVSQPSRTVFSGSVKWDEANRTACGRYISARL